MSKWSKYNRHFVPKWLKEPALKNWLEPTPEEDCIKGMKPAYCKLCRCYINAKHSDLIKHAGTDKHRAAEKSFNRAEQSALDDHGYDVVKNADKVADCKLAVYIAMHTSVKSVDHLNDLLKKLGHGSCLQKCKLHRTKCNKIINNVVAPAFLEEVLEDVGDSDYALIVDEATDVSATKFMGICIRYFSKKREEMITDFLGIVPVTNCTGKALATALIDYLEKIKLPLENFHAVGTDGAPNMCGVNDSFYTHLKERIPRLILIQCICHSIDKCAEYAFKKLDSVLTYILAESHNYFTHSAKRWGEYVEYYKTKNQGKEPAKLPQLSDTRWLVWVPVSKQVIEQWTSLGGFFKSKEAKCHKAKLLAAEYNDTNLLYLTFLKAVLDQVSELNLAFERANTDLSKLYTDMRSLVFTLAQRILKKEAIPETSRPGILKPEEISALKQALNNPHNQRPVDQVDLGIKFHQLQQQMGMEVTQCNEIRKKCGEYIFTLLHQLLDRLPRNADHISKIRYFSPQLVLARTARPTFQQLPLEFAGESVDLGILENQWMQIGTLSLPEICLHNDRNTDPSKMDAVHFWACARKCTNAGGNTPFKELADFALRVLTLPISNADIERVFSVLALLKTKQRNRLQLASLQSLLRVRCHLRAYGRCCTTFEPTKSMMVKFNASMYRSVHDEDEENGSDPFFQELEDEDYAEVMTLFNEDGTNCVVVSAGHSPGAA